MSTGRWEPDSASDTLIFWNKDLECINDGRNKRVEMRMRRVVIWKRNESRSNEVCSPSKSPYIPQTEYQK